MRAPLLLMFVMSACAAEPAVLPAPEEFREVCAPYFACACEVHQFSDLNACMTYHHAAFAEVLGAAEAAGLHADLECYRARERPGEDMCLGSSAYNELHPYEDPREPSLCGECQPVYGEREVGEACVRVAAGGSDCAQGLVCADGPTDVCIDPCAPTPVGEPCWFGVSSCGPGRYCDIEAEVCRAEAQLEQSCLATDCAEGLVCDRGSDYCVMPAALDEPCNTRDCEDGLVCLHLEFMMVCRTIPGEGEYCEGDCRKGLACDRATHLCIVPGEPGAACASEEQCRLELLCTDGTCQTRPGEGEVCEYYCEAGLECHEDVCVREPPRICLL